MSLSPTDCNLFTMPDGRTNTELKFKVTVTKSDSAGAYSFEGHKELDFLSAEQSITGSFQEVTDQLDHTLSGRYSLSYKGELPNKEGDLKGIFDLSSQCWEFQANRAQFSQICHLSKV